MLFMSIATIVSILTVLFMPKRLNHQEIYCTWIVMALLTRTYDQILDLILHLYDQLGPGIEWQSFVIQTVFPGAMGVIILNFMPHRKLTFFSYVVGWTLISVVFEWITIKIGYLTYNKWSLWYSAGIYFLGLIFLRWHLSFLRKGENKLQ